MKYSNIRYAIKLWPQTGEALETRALDLLHPQLPDPVRVRRKMLLRDTCRVRVMMREAKGSSQGLEVQEDRIVPVAHHRGQDSPAVMLKRIPQPRRPLFGPDDTPHIIKLGGASCRDAKGV